MKKIILLSAVLLAVNFAFAAGDDTVAATSDNKVIENKQETKLVAENKHDSSKWYGGASKSLCKSWKERGVGWEIWPLYKMGKSSCEMA